MQLAPTKRFVSDDEFDINPLVILIQSPILNIELTPALALISPVQFLSKDRFCEFKLNVPIN